MRVIKFRIWDKKHESFVNEPFYAIGLDGTIHLGAHHSTEPDRYIVQQFTGLTDKSGKEVYEGDLVRGEVLQAYTMPNTPPNPGIYEVGYSGYMQLFPFHVPMGHDGELWIDVLVDGFEVIGNACEAANSKERKSHDHSATTR